MERVAPRWPGLRWVGKGHPLSLFLDADEMFHLVDHSPHRRRVFENAPTVPLVQSQPLQRRFLVRLTTDRAPRLHDRHRPLVLHYAFSRASASRRPRISPTFLPRRAATPRGLVARLNATKVALIILCGFGLPIDLATTSWTPSASKIARIGPPAMIPVPGFSARTIPWPAP